MVLATGETIYRTRSLPARHYCTIKAVFRDCEITDFLGLLDPDSDANRVLYSDENFFFGEENPLATMNVKVLSRGKVVRDGQDSYEVEFRILLRDSLSVGAIDNEILQKIPYEYPNGTEFRDDARIRLPFSGGAELSGSFANTWTAQTKHFLTPDEIKEVRKFYFYGVRHESFTLDLNFPIFGEDCPTPYSNEVRILGYSESYISGGLWNVSLTIERLA